MDLHISIDPTKPLAAQLYAALRDAIFDGRIDRGFKLPASRSLAQRLQLSRKTVNEAYDRLSAEGLVYTKAGSGTFVGHASSPPPSHAMTVKPRTLRPQPRWAGARARAMDNLGRGWKYDFSGGTLKLDRFPFAEWRASLQKAVREQARNNGFSIETAGHPALREGIARYLSINRAVRCDPSDILVTHGALQAISLLGAVMAGAGAKIAMEEPGYTPVRHGFVAQGAVVVSVPVDAEGIRVDLIPDDVRVVYVTPSHQFPLGMVMSLRRRHELLAWASRHRALIIEDDYDGEFRFDGRPVDSLQSLDPHGVVAYVGTFSKTMFPELRLGYMTMPAGLEAALICAKQLADRHSCALQQHALADFIDRGEFARHIQRMQKRYAQVRERLLERLTGDLACWLEPIVPQAGIHLAALTRPDVQFDLLKTHLADREVFVSDMMYFFHGTPVDGLLLGFGAIDIADVSEGIDRIAEALAASCR